MSPRIGIYYEITLRNSSHLSRINDRRILPCHSSRQMDQSARNRALITGTFTPSECLTCTRSNSVDLKEGDMSGGHHPLVSKRTGSTPVSSGGTSYETSRALLPCVGKIFARTVQFRVSITWKCKLTEIYTDFILDPYLGTEGINFGSWHVELWNFYRFWVLCGPLGRSFLVKKVSKMCDGAGVKIF